MAKISSQKKKSLSLISEMLQGDKRALARLMTFVDNRHEDLMAIMAEVYRHKGHAQIIGITGPPGAGKSTLVDKLIKIYRSEGKSVGVVAVDPSSPFTGGAVLGDRIRMMEHSADDGVFIRSLGSRGSHGGLSRATRDVVHLMDSFGFDVILIETVGVGQTELDIMAVAQTTVVVLVPESGDTIQTMKAGLMEIADVFVVNKSDREGADRIAAELVSLAEMEGGSPKGGSPKGGSPKGGFWKIPVLKTEAIKGKGINELASAIDDHQKCLSKGVSRYAPTAEILKEECLDIFSSEVRAQAAQALKKDKTLVSGHRNPYETASGMMKRLRWTKDSSTR